MELLKTEWLKIRKYTTFWVLTSLFAGLYLLWNYGVNKSMVSLSAGPMNMMSTTYSFPSVWSNMGFIYGWFVYFLAIFVIISISNEFSFRTHRQHIIDGLHRLDFLHSKSILILGLSIASTLFYIISSLIFGFINGGSSPLDGAEKILYVFVYTLNYLSFSALIAFFIRRSGLSIVILFAYLFLEFIMTKIINWQFDSNFGNLLPLQSSDELLPLNAMKSFEAIMPGQHADINPMIYLVASCIYIILYYIIARRKLVTADL